MRFGRLWRIGGLIAGVVLVAFGVVVIVLAVQGHNTVSDELKQQQITGSPDMTPEGDQGRGREGGTEERHASDLRRCRPADRRRS